MGTTTATFYLPLRGVSGLFSAGAGAASRANKKFWKPPKNAAWINPKTFGPTPEFSSFIDYVVEKILGGSNNRTLPQVENLITYAQAESLFASMLGSAQAQQVNANAQSLAALREMIEQMRQVLEDASTPNIAAVPTIAQIPPVQLAPVEVSPPYVDLAPTSGGGGGGAGGD